LSQAKVELSQPQASVAQRKQAPVGKGIKEKTAILSHEKHEKHEKRKNAFLLGYENPGICLCPPRALICRIF
jgi:hypothetical protein